MLTSHAQAASFDTHLPPESHKVNFLVASNFPTPSCHVLRFFVFWCVYSTSYLVSDMLPDVGDARKEVH